MKRQLNVEIDEALLWKIKEQAVRHRTELRHYVSEALLRFSQTPVAERKLKAKKLGRPVKLT
jgi:hypothetical protein